MELQVSPCFSDDTKGMLAANDCLRNLRIRDTLARAHVPLDQLRLALAPHTNATASPQTATAGSASPPQITDVTQPVRARLPHVLPQPVARAVAVAALVDGALQVVGGVQIGPSPVEEGEPVAKRKRGKDGAGVKRTRTCKRCKAWGEVEQGQTCVGRGKGGVAACEYFEQDPEEEEAFEEDGGEE